MLTIARDERIGQRRLPVVHMRQYADIPYRCRLLLQGYHFFQIKRRHFRKTQMNDINVIVEAMLGRRGLLSLNVHWK